MRRSIPYLLGLALVGCGPGGSPDAGPPPEPDAGGAGRREAALPDLGPCPEGWAEASVDGVRVCDPAPGGAMACPAREARFVGTSACAPLGACPAGDFADDLPPGAIRVQPGGAGGPGSPFGTIAEAVAAASAGDTIALAKGRYDEAVSLPVGVTLRGACAAETTLTLSAAGPGQGAVALRGGAILDLAIVDSAGAGVVVRGGDVLAERVAIEGAVGYGVIVVGGRLEARDVAIRAVVADADGAGGFGLATTGADVSAAFDRAVFEGHQRAAAIALDGSTIAVHDVAARDATGAGGGLGAGFVAQDGASVTGARVEVSRAVGAGILVNPAGRVALSDVVVDEVSGARQGWAVSSAGEASLTRAWLRRATGTTVNAANGARVVLEDVVVEDAQEDGAVAGFAQGLGVIGTGAVEVARVLVTECAAGAVSVIGLGVPGARISGRDLTLRDSRDLGVAGVGLYVADGGDATLDGLTVERTTHGAIVVSRASATLSNVRVTDTQPDADDGLFGRGVEAIESVIALRDARLEGQHEIAVIVSGGRATLSGVELIDTAERGCARTSCPDAPGGIGLGVYRGASVSASDFVIRGMPLCGVQVAEGGSLDLARGEIRDASIGACVQVEGYDVARLADGVVYADTDTAIQTTSHYVPESSGLQL